MSRIALIYVPWLGIVLDNLNRFNLTDKQEEICANISINRISTSSSYLFGKSTVSSEYTASRSHRFTLHMDNRDSPMHLRNSAFFDAIAGQRMWNEIF